MADFLFNVAKGRIVELANRVNDNDPTNTSLTVTTDDSGDLQSVDMADQTFSAIASGDGWTDLLVCYDSDTTGGTDSNIIPLMQFDAPVTPDGTDIIVAVNASGLMSAS